MAKRAYGKRRKGISIAAGLVALSLVAQVAPATVLPVQPAVASAQEAAADATTKGAPIDADGIASGKVTKMDQLGDYKFVKDNRGDNHGGMVGGRLFSSTTGTFSTVGANPEVLTGYTVYSQWMDEDNAVSPVYKAKTADIEGTAGSGKGAFVFHYPNWTDGNGKVHEFNGKPYKVRIRMWIAPDQVGPAGGKLITLRQAPGIQSGFMNQSDGGAGMWSNVPQSFQYTGIFVYELPSDLMYAKESDKDRYHVDTLGVPTGSSFNAADRSAVTGRIWWETGRTESGTITFPVSTGENFVGKDEARVTTSILTNEGVQAFEKLKNLDRPERIKKQQELLKNNPKYIAETVVAYTNDKGEYYARFNKKNFDRRYLYQFVEMKDKDGNWKVQPAYSSYLAPMFGQPNETMNIPQLWQDVRHTWANMHFAIVREPEQAQLAIDEDVVYATNKVTPKISALVNEGETAYVQWVNSKGEKIKRDGTPGEEQIPVKGGHNIANPFADATLTVPAQDKLKADDTYTAQLWVNGALVAADSVSVALNGPDSDAAKYAPKYETTYIQPVEGKDLSVGCGVPAADDPQNLKPTGTSCKQIRGVGRIANIADIPADKIKSIKVTGVENTTENPKLFGKNANGWAGGPVGGFGLGDPQIKGTGWGPGSEANMKDLRDRLGLQGDRTESDIPVGIAMDKAKVGQYQDVNVEVTYADGTKDNIVARFVYGTEADDPNVDKPTLADQREVSYPDTPATAGKKASAKPELKKADGSAFPAEEVTKYEKGASPEGVSDDEWSVDPATGEVTYTPKAGTQPGKVTFPVKVTYKDGSSENTTATFTVKEDKTTRSDVDYREKTTVPQGGTKTVPAPTDAEGRALEGATYELKEPDTYKWVTLNKDGSLTVKPTADTPKGTYYIPVMVKETNGADQLIYAEVEVTDQEQTAKPTVDKVTEGDKEVSGKTEPKAKVTVTLPDGTKVETTADEDGKFT
ncbi:Rib/alpha-like domain-containing protein, partial [Corynebacterium glucuronolyticum]|uniref:Rib/alpha-like domain-containing protein n=1 Tax=Corynebacterium glucuronolyticum TaxID=39791 RepID=UPI003F6DF3B0